MPISSPPTFKNPAQAPIDLTAASVGEVVGVVSTGPVVMGLVSGGGGGTAPAFKSSVTDASPGASANNYSPTGYSGGVTNRLLVNAAPTTLTGLVAATDGWVLYLRNTSTTNALTLAHMSGSSSAANQFSCPQGVNAILAPLTGVQLIYVTNVWTFS